jgi:endonuclease/exonuclease/phosphatase family metal-dependent hydrolase
LAISFHKRSSNFLPSEVIAMKITVGTFNLNNLFSRYNFKGEIKAIKTGDTTVAATLDYTFGPRDDFRIRTYRGKLVKAKGVKKTLKVVDRIMDMDVDVLAVQEVEDIDTLRAFNRDKLTNLYRYVTLIEGNDDRLIDVGLLSKYPVGAVTSWQHAVHKDSPARPIFGRDLMETQILSRDRKKILFTLFNNHLKSHFCDYREDKAACTKKNNKRRKRQSDMIAQIVKKQTRPTSRFVILGDMNDPPDSPHLTPFTADAELKLTNALANARETKAPTVPRNIPAPPHTHWTHRYKETGKPAAYELYDQIWVSNALSARITGAWIHRRKNLTGDGSDHDPAWIELHL